jgi:uncharacterized membrane protein YraQ (UPF0718 family)
MVNILIGTILLIALAAALLGHLRRTQPEAVPEAFRRTGETMVFLLPRLAVGLTGAGFLAALLPAELIARVFGEQSGVSGVLLATLAGVVTPGGPFVAFAIAASGLKAGAGIAAAAAYVVSWSVICLTRSLTWELPVLGAGFTLARWAVSVPVPLIIGLILLS